MLDELLAKLSETMGTDTPVESQPAEKLAQARTLLRAGQFAQAAPIFEELTDQARQKNLPGLAGETALKAAQCYVRAGNIPKADVLGQDAVRLLLQAGRYERVAQVAPKVIQALERQGRRREAQALRVELRRSVPPEALPGPGMRRGMGPRRRPLMPPAERPLVQRELPTTCASCGAPVRADEVDWTGPASAACSYCGAGLKVTLNKIE